MSITDKINCWEMGISGKRASRFRLHNIVLSFPDEDFCRFKRPPWIVTADYQLGLNHPVCLSCRLPLVSALAEQYSSLWCMMITSPNGMTRLVFQNISLQHLFLLNTVTQERLDQPTLTFLVGIMIGGSFVCGVIFVSFFPKPLSMVYVFKRS